MFVGLLMLTAAWGVTQNGWIICYAWSLFFYGIGVGECQEHLVSIVRFANFAQVVNIP
jgi:hypothetical protein